jgi:hypothetical protein
MQIIKENAFRGGSFRSQQHSQQYTNILIIKEIA